jgi:DNA-binding beta-propeller fold protein YncE
MGIDTNRERGAAVRSRLAFPRVGWVTLATVLLAAGVLLVFALELRFIVRSRPAGEIPSSIVWVTGGRGPEPGYFDAPIGLVAHPSGDIYVADLGNARVQRLGSDGAFLSLWPAPGSIGPSLTQPSDVAVGSAGEVYVLDAGGAIYRLEPDGGLTATIPLAPLPAYSPRGFAVDHARGRLYVANTGHGRVLVLGIDGSLIDTWGGAPDDDLGFEEPWGLGLDSEGNLFVAETANSRIRKMSPEGAVLTEWKAKGPLFDLAVGPDDRVYVTAADRARLWVYDNQGKALGQVTALFEERPLGAARGVAVLGPGEVVMGTEASIVRVSLRFDE